MLFNSVPFLVFFVVVTVLYFLVPHRGRWALLLAASCYFYMVFKPIYILILLFTILVDYAAGLAIERAPDEKRRLFLVISICANAGILAYFKYFNFLNETFRGLFHTAGAAYSIPALAILLPIGLSFHIFQSLSYTIEVYRGKQPAEKHLGIYALYVMFYPQLVAGPIERPQNLIHQFRERHYFEYARVVAGLQLMLWGFFKKVVIADRLAPFVNEAYDHPSNYHGLAFIVATVFFAFQIYCDFSGYSDIAIGSAQVMGFRLMRNFDRPYLSGSIREFWKRWHISLSSWFRDYVYLPLGGNRVARPRWYFNLLSTFVLSGLWHGANWTFVLWGAINGIYLVAETAASRLFSPRPEKSSSSIGRAGRVLGTFALTCFAWIFFRANSVGDAFGIVRHLGDGLISLPRNLTDLVFLKNNVLLRQTQENFVIAILGLLILFGVEFLQAQRGDAGPIIARQPVWVRWGVCYAGLAMVLFYGAFNTSQQFIYFQF